MIGFNGCFFPNNWRPARKEIAFARAYGFTALQFPGKEEGLDSTHLGDPLSIMLANCTGVALQIRLSSKSAGCPNPAVMAAIRMRHWWIHASVFSKHLPRHRQLEQFVLDASSQLEYAN
jgi:hypothetical protein